MLLPSPGPVTFAAGLMAHPAFSAASAWLAVEIDAGETRVADSVLRHNEICSGSGAFTNMVYAADKSRNTWRGRTKVVERQLAELQSPQK